MLRLFLGLNVLVWLPYGLFCFLQPGSLYEVAGIAIDTTTASTEIRAMYGGLQASIGCFALAALVRSQLVRPVLLSIAFLTGGLALGRLGGILADGGVSTYTGGAVCFELVLASWALFLLSRQASAGAAKAPST